MDMSEEELVARIKELANDPKRRTGSAQMFPEVPGLPPP
jgi:hypothetical protein